MKLDELVNPNKAVADYRSEITGVTAEDLVGVTCSLAEIQVKYCVFFLVFRVILCIFRLKLCTAFFRKE